MMWKRFLKQKMAVFCLIFLAVLFVGVIIGSTLVNTPTETRVSLTTRSQPPSAAHILGTDTSGRDMLGQLIIGARNSLFIALGISVLTGVFGSLFGLLSGYCGGWVDMLMMRALDFVSMLPRLMLVIVIVSLMPNYGTGSLILVMSAIGWMYDARIIRGKSLQLRSADFIQAAKVMGTKTPTILLRHIFPHILPVIIVNFTLNLAGNVGVESGLSFLGFGLPFATPSLGTLLSYARIPENLQGRPWLWLPASLLILAVMLSIHCIGQALKRVVDDNNKN